MENFYREIMTSEESSFYGKYIRPTDREHVNGRIYYIGKQHDGALYSCDFRGLGHGGYVSNILSAGYFI